MSDQSTPPRPTIAAAATEPYRSNTNVRVEVPPGPSPAGGFSTGILVAAVFVVVAIIAAAVFSNRDVFGIGTTDAPAISIENNTAPAAAAPAPAATVVDPVAPANPAPAPAVVDPAPDAAPAAPMAPANP